MSGLSDGFLDPVARVIETAQNHVPDLIPDQIMLVGAWSRDVLHAALGHHFETSATRDIDLALALSAWDTYEQLAAAFARAGDTGLRFNIAGLKVDLLPFGGLEDPEGIITPPTRDESISVWAFDEIYSASVPLTLTPSLQIRVPTVPGYAAAKMAAWLDRSEWHQTKDANDLALVAYWYAESVEVHDRLYATTEGQRTLVEEESDVPRAAARLLGEDVAALLGSRRITELAARWPGDRDTLMRNFTINAGSRWPERVVRRREVVDALTRGLVERK